MSLAPLGAELFNFLSLSYYFLKHGFFFYLFSISFLEMCYRLSMFLPTPRSASPLWLLPQKILRISSLSLLILILRKITLWLHRSKFMLPSPSVATFMILLSFPFWRDVLCCSSWHLGILSQGLKLDFLRDVLPAFITSATTAQPGTILLSSMTICSLWLLLTFWEKCSRNRFASILWQFLQENSLLAPPDFVYVGMAVVSSIHFLNLWEWNSVTFPLLPISYMKGTTKCPWIWRALTTISWFSLPIEPISVWHRNLKME